MQYGVSYIYIDNSAIQKAIAAKAAKDFISYLKQSVAFTTVYGFDYVMKSFGELANCLTHDLGFSPVRFKSVEEGAIYNKEKHPNAYGRVRGRENISGQLTWVCLDIDDTNVSDVEVHSILHKYKHHIARTSNKNNPYKYRIILPLSTPATLDNKTWKFFIKSIADSLHLKIDNLGLSHCYYGYNNRNVLSSTSGIEIDPSTHLKMALTKVVELEEKYESEIPAELAAEQLQHPYTTFEFAYEAHNGDGTYMLLGAITKAKKLGASRDYIVALLNSINNFWDNPMPQHRLESTVLTAI